MRITVQRGLLAMVVTVCLALQVATAEPIRATSAHNPPPTEMLGLFDRVEVRPLTLATDDADSRSGRKAADSIRRNFQKELQAWVAAQNGRASRNDPPRLLVIEPRIDGVRLVGSAARFWLGPFMGSSRVLLRLRLVDAASGAVVAEPEFYQHTRAMSGGFTLGVLDKAMLVRVTALAANYLENNTNELLGGPTGAEGNAMAPAGTAVSAQASPAASAANPGVAAQSGTLANTLAYTGDPAHAARSLAAVHNCNAQFRQQETSGARSEFVAGCWGSRTIRISCEAGACTIAP